MPPASPGLEALWWFPRHGVAGRGRGAPRRSQDASGPPGSGPLMRGSHRPSWRKLCPPTPPGCGLLHQAGESRGPLCPSWCPRWTRGRGGCRSREWSGPSRPGAARGQPHALPVAPAGGAAVSLPAAGRTAKAAAAKPCPALPATCPPVPMSMHTVPGGRHREPRGASEPPQPFPVAGGEGPGGIPTVLRECRGGQWLSTPRMATWSPAGEARLPGPSTLSYPQILS